MKFSLFALSALPTAWATVAYFDSLPQSLALKAADETNDCVLPDDYHVVDFTATSNNVGKNLTTFSFIFKDDTTKITTPCHFNSTSRSSPGTRTPRYTCDNSKIEFIHETEEGKLWMIQQVCPGDDGVADYEVSGSVDIPLKCPKTPGNCTANSTDYTALFTSLNPTQNTPPTKLKFRA
ncbi:Fc.00g068940.m01.CDS01 [Cosmosporella sp. VM-42]